MTRLTSASAMLIAIAVLGTLSTATVSASAPASQGVEDDRLGRALRRGLEEVGTPGIAASVVFADGRQWTAFAGQADTADRRRVTATTPFAVASVTKTFVAALALQLAEEGTVDLDAPVEPWLPDVPGSDVITLRQLLSHTSGLNNGPIGAPSHRWTAEEVLASMDPPACAPGTCFRYADMNYVAAGAVLEAATEKSVPRLVRRRFLAPLGMTHTWFQGAERARGEVATGYRNGVPQSDGILVPSADFVTRTGFSGSIATTAGDLAIWGDALLGGKVLRRAPLREMLDFEATADLPCPVLEQCAGGYGLGMGFDGVNAWPVWQHSGSTGALLTYFPTQRITVAVVTNGAPGAPPGAFPGVRALADEVPSLQRRGAVFAIDAGGSNRHQVTPKKLLAGAPALSPDGTRLAFVIEREGGSDIAVGDADGKHHRLLAHENEWSGVPAWSPDGRRIAFEAERNRSSEIFVMDVAGSDPVQLTDHPGSDGSPEWSPDGTLIAFSRHVEDRLDILVMRPDGSEQRSVVSMTVHGRFTGAPSWSHDGSQLVFGGDVERSPNIQIVDLEGSDLTAVTTGHATATEPAWAPDGTIVFTRLGTLYTVEPGGGGAPQRIDRSEDTIDFLPAWSPDSRTVLFTANAR